jgi:hypothetical protein
VGVIGLSEKFVGVWGESTADAQPGVFGTSAKWQGVHGKSVDQVGVAGDSDRFVGVWGESKGDGQPGVFGINAIGPGVRGFSGAQPDIPSGADRFVGVLGQGKSGSTGVLGKSDTGHGVKAVSVGDASALYVENSGNLSAVLIDQHSNGKFIVCRPGAGGGNLFQVLNSGDAEARGVKLTCDRNAKANLSGVDGRQILEKLACMPIQNWNYKTDPASVRHIGPTSQDFQSAFGLNGDDDVHISAVDAHGIALAAIQGLNEKLQAENAELRTSLASLETRLAALESMA